MSQHSTVQASAVRAHEPARRVIATFDDYADAERAVDHLSDQGFEVDKVAIIGRDMEYHEQVLGRLNYGGAALRGAGSGAIVGALIGWVFGLFNWIDPVLSAAVLACYGIVFGAIVGALFGLAMHALQRGRRDFHSVSAVRPKYYDVVADSSVADRAVQLLSGVTDGRN
ncbi:glycine zipper family protein [Mycobacterium yunnanensis]|uniref:Glycine zipper family protein n=1 Tax=Mycobacterium yunnanensis TaxID=368477 RepID=A0A9X3BUU7_9MYCO|nr:general stress protein [Mycobacterium yunnanensis]MCV7423094.1 glycine zipper family protein [Mycobacterium yunnanensis]